MMNVAAKIAEIESSNQSEMQKSIAMSDLKLKHYNEFLTNPDRELGTVYPGFPGEKNKTETVVEKVTKMKKQRAEKAAKAPKAESKKVAALRIFNEENGVRAAVLARFQSELSMSKAGASTYFYSTKALSK